MPQDEGVALYDSAVIAQRAHPGGPMLEVGSYCGKSSVYLGEAAHESGAILFALDHHRGSEENQAGWEHHEPDLVDPETNKMDTLPKFRKTVFDAGLEESVVALVGNSVSIGTIWTTPLAFLFIDGGHGEKPAHKDYELWTPHVAEDGILAIHDVFEDPSEGGRPPFEIYTRAIESGNFEEIGRTGSLRVLKRLANGSQHRPDPKF